MSDIYHTTCLQLILAVSRALYAYHSQLSAPILLITALAALTPEAPAWARPRVMPAPSPAAGL